MSYRVIFKCHFKAKKLPATFEEDLNEGEVTEEDSADEMEEYFKCKNSEVRLESNVIITSIRPIICSASKSPNR